MWKFQKKASTVLPEKYNTAYIPGTFFSAREIDHMDQIVVIDGIIKSGMMYCYSLIEERFYDDLMQVYPTIFVKPHSEKSFKKIENNDILESTHKQKSMGKEEERQNRIKNFFSCYVNILENLAEELAPYESYTFRIEKKCEITDVEVFVVGGVEAAEKIHFKTFMKNFVELQESPLWLDKVVDKVYSSIVKKCFS